MFSVSMSVFAVAINLGSDCVLYSAAWCRSPCTSSHRRTPRRTSRIPPARRTPAVLCLSSACTRSISSWAYTSCSSCPWRRSLRLTGADFFARPSCIWTRTPPSCVVECVESGRQPTEKIATGLATDWAWTNPSEKYESNGTPSPK